MQATPSQQQSSGTAAGVGVAGQSGTKALETAAFRDLYPVPADLQAFQDRRERHAVR